MEINKNTLRKEALQTRRQVTKKNEYAIKTADTLLRNIPISKEDSVGVYFPSNSEVSTINLIDKLQEEGVCISLPVIIQKNTPLIFREYKKGDPLVKSKFFNIKEPNSSAELATPNIIVTPLLAFDKRGYRLGYGGGFYDRTIEKLKKEVGNLITIGFAYSAQEVKEIPIDRNDQKLDYLATEKQFLKF